MARLLKISPIQKLADVGSYAEGLEAYQKLSNPTSNDDRWAAICLWNLGRLEDAKIMFTKAARRGENGALIGLASICRLLGDLVESETHLNAAFNCSLNSDDWVRALRERGNLHIVRSELKAGLESYLDARLEAELCSEIKTLIPVIDAAIGYSYHLLGFHLKAKEFLDKAALSKNRFFLLSIRVIRIFIDVYSGNLIGVKNALENGELKNSEYSMLNANKFYIHGIYEIIQFNWNEARLFFTQGIEIAEKTGVNEYEFLLKIGLCKVYIGLEQFEKARTALKRTENLKINTQDIAARDLTAGVLTTLGNSDLPFSSQNT
jgi:tetratricopeptide (TPR) repeat protein